MFQRLLSPLLLCALLCSACVAPPCVRAEDGAMTVEQNIAPGKKLFTSSLWRTMEVHTQKLSPAWQRRYQELRSIAEDTDSLGTQLPLQLDELRRKFKESQQSVVFLLLDLAPATMEALDNYYLMCRLEEWQWYLAEPMYYVGKVEQGLTFYANVLQEVGEALARSRTAATPANAALLEVLPELRSTHALLEARVEYLQKEIESWLDPARAMSARVQTALETTQRVQPQLWLNYYTTPLRISHLGWERAWSDLKAMGETLKRGEILPRPSKPVEFVALFVLGLCVLLYRMVEKNCAGSLSAHAPLWRVLGAALHAQSFARKAALAVGAVCSLNLYLDATAFVHVHMPFLTLQMCLLHVSVAIWARDSRKDPPLPLLILPVVVGYVLLESNAPALWMQGGMMATLLSCTMALCLRRERSAFSLLWLGALGLGFVLCFVGFSRLVALGLGCLLFCRVAYVVLGTLFQARGLHHQPLLLSLLMPFLMLWVYSLGLVLSLGYNGVDAMWDHMQADALQFFGIQMQLRDLLFLLTLGMGLLIFAGISQQMLHSVSRQRNVLDPSAVPVIHAVVNSLLWVLFLLFALGLLGVDMRSIAFIGGALTVGIGLGLQNIISNFFSGLVIIFARVVRSGDLIEVGSVHGHVHSVNMRATVVETLTGAVLLIPNVEMLNSRLTNWTRNNRYVRDDLVFCVALGMDVDKTMRLMESVAASHADILQSPAPVALLLKTGNGEVEIALQVWVNDVDRRRSILSTLRAEVAQAFEREGIHLSEPQLNVALKPDA